MKPRLTAKQVGFVKAFFNSPNLAVAARRAGFAETGAAAAGARMMALPIVVDAIEKAAKDLGVAPLLGAAGVDMTGVHPTGRPRKIDLAMLTAAQAGQQKPIQVKRKKPKVAKRPPVRKGKNPIDYTPAAILAELAAIGFANISDVMGWYQCDRTLFDDNGNPVEVPDVLLTVKDSDQLTPEKLVAVAEISRTKDGTVKIKMHDKIGALVKLGQAQGMFKTVEVPKLPGEAGKKADADAAALIAQQGTGWDSLLPMQ